MHVCIRTLYKAVAAVDIVYMIAQLERNFALLCDYSMSLYLSEHCCCRLMTVVGKHSTALELTRCTTLLLLVHVCSLLFDKVSQEAATTSDTSSSSTNDDSSTQQHSSSSTSSVTLAVATGHRKSISMSSALQQQQLTPTARCAYLVMSDLCTLSRGESGRWYVYYPS
jgi:hypothetical protein